MLKLGRQAKRWRATVDSVADQLLLEHGPEAFWMAERFRRSPTLTATERRLSEDVFAEVERRTRSLRSSIDKPPRSYLPAGA